MSRRLQSTAIQLLAKVVATRWFTNAALARELVISEATLDAYLSEKVAMPIDRQLCLAAFVIEQIPPLARAAHRLRAQLHATIAFQSRETVTHNEFPFRFR
jgi:hypothetical protein